MRLLVIFVLSMQLFASDFNSNDGAPIRQGVHIEWYRTIAPGYNGEGIFVWSDTRFGMRNIFAHKIDAHQSRESTSTTLLAKKTPISREIIV